jgi:hypothetical protein
VTLSNKQLVELLKTQGTPTTQTGDDFRASVMRKLEANRFQSTARVCREQHQVLGHLPAASTGPQSFEVGDTIGNILTKLHESLLSPTLMNLLMAKFNEHEGFAIHPAGASNGIFLVPKTGYPRINAPSDSDRSDGVKVCVWEAVRAIVKCIRQTLSARMKNFAREIDPSLLDTCYPPDQTNLSRSLAQTRAKAIIARNDANSGYTTYSELGKRYLNGATDVSTREAKTQSDRLDRQRKDSVKTVRYYRNGHNLGTVSTLTAAENAGFLHGMEFDIAQAAGRCTPHQDWMTEDTVVFAFAIFRHGLRVMLQLTMRIKGGIEKAQEAMSILRQHLFGVRVQGTKTVPEMVV